MRPYPPWIQKAGRAVHLGNVSSTVEPARVRTMLALLKTQDDQSAKSIWPSLVRAPIFVDHPGGQSQKKGQDFIFWDN